MKKLLKKLAVAASVVVAALSLSAVATFAAEIMWVPNDDGAATAPAELGMVYSSDKTLSGGNYTGTFAEAIFSDSTNAIAGKTAIDIQSGASAYTSDTKSIVFAPTTSGTVSLYIARTSSNSGAQIRLYEGAVSSGTYTRTNTELMERVTSGGRNTADIPAITFDVTANNVYVLYSNNSGAGLFGVKFTYNDSGVTTYWPDASAQTYADEAWLGGTPTTFTSGKTLSNGAVNNGGKESSSRIRLGKDAAPTDGSVMTIANQGFITFPYTGDGIVSITASSSGETSSRTLYLGTYDASTGTFTDISPLTVTGNVGENVTVPVTSTDEVTYAVYVKPHDESTPADNTNILSIEVLPEGAVLGVTPAVTLSSATVESGVLTITGTFNDFTGTLYEVYEITLNAALGKEVETEAVWKLNDITKLIDNGDGTASFIATVADPGEAARFQAIAKYDGIDALTADVSAANAVSNQTIYSPAA